MEFHRTSAVDVLQYVGNETFKSTDNGCLVYCRGTAGPIGLDEWLNQTADMAERLRKHDHLFLITRQGSAVNVSKADLEQLCAVLHIPGTIMHRSLVLSGASQLDETERGMSWTWWKLTVPALNFRHCCLAAGTTNNSDAITALAIIDNETLGAFHNATAEFMGELNPLPCTLLRALWLLVLFMDRSIQLHCMFIWQISKHVDLSVSDFLDFCKKRLKANIYLDYSPPVSRSICYSVEINTNITRLPRWHSARTSTLDGF